MYYDDPLIVNTTNDIPILSTLLYEKYHCNSDMITVITETILIMQNTDHIIYMVYDISEMMATLINEICNPNNTISTFQDNGCIVLEDAIIYNWKMVENCVLSRDQFNLPINFMFIVKKLVKPLIPNLIKPLIRL